MRRTADPVNFRATGIRNENPREYHILAARPSLIQPKSGADSLLALCIRDSVPQNAEFDASADVYTPDNKEKNDGGEEGCAGYAIN